ncbi:MAG: PsbP-related protein [Chloroflexota bacterium]|nr:PsbP-related protein [Chloroflexota bacterium]
MRVYISVKPVINLLVLITLSIFLVSCGGGSNDPSSDEDVPDGYYQNAEHGIGFQPPDEWEKYYPSVGVVAFRTPGVTSYANMSLVVESTSDGLNEYAKSNKDGLSSIAGLTIAGEEPQESIGDKEAYELSIYIELNEDESNEVRQEHTIWVEDGKGYCLIFSALTDKWSDYQQTFQEVRSSFIFDI